MEVRKRKPFLLAAGEASFLTITGDVPSRLDGKTLSLVKCFLNFCQSVQFSIAVLHNNFKASYTSRK